MGHHRRIVAHSFSFSATPYGLPSDPFHPLVNLSADPCGCLGPSTPSADAAAGRGLGCAQQLCSMAWLLLDQQQELSQELCGSSLSSTTPS